MASNTIKVSVLGDVKDINRKLGNVESQIGGFGKKISGLGKLVAGAFAGVAVASVFKDIVKSASDAQQSLGATETVFGKFADTVIKTSDNAATKYGLSANSYRENANLIGSLFKNQGVAVDQLAGKTETMIAKASDLSATFGGDTKSAVEALSSAFKGEFDPLERYGISLKQSTVSAEAMRLANVKSAKDWGKLTLAQQKAYTQQATTNLINKQSADSAGAFAKETDTLAHQQQVLAAKVENVKTKIGNAFLPILTKAASFVSDTVLPALERFGNWFSENALPKIKEFGSQLGATLLPALQNLGTFLTGTVVPAMQSLVQWLQQNATWLMPIAVGIGAIVLAWKAYQTYLTIVSAVTKAYTAIQAALNVVMSANPIGILVLAIVGLIAAFIYLWKTNDSFREAVIKAWNAIKSAASSVFNWLKGFLSGVWSAIKTAFTRFTILGIVLSHWGQIKSFVTGAASAVKSAVVNAWNAVKSASSSAWNAVKSTISTVWNGIKSGVTTGINAVVSLVRGIRSRVTGALSGAGSWLIGIGKNVVQGLISGIGSLAGSVTRALLNLLPGPLRKFAGKLGIHSPSTVFKGFGKNIVQGLVLGIQNNSRSVSRAASGMAGEVANGFEAPRLSLAGAGVGGGVGNTYKITVNALDPQSASRSVMDAIKEHERLNGSGWRR